MIGVTSAGEGRLTAYWRQHDRLVRGRVVLASWPWWLAEGQWPAPARWNTERNKNSQLRRGRILNATKV